MTTMLDRLKGWKHILAARAYMLAGAGVALSDIAHQVASANNVDMFAFVPPDWKPYAVMGTGILIESARRNLTPPAP